MPDAVPPSTPKTGLRSGVAVCFPAEEPRLMERLPISVCGSIQRIPLTVPPRRAPSQQLWGTGLPVAFADVFGNPQGCFRKHVASRRGDCPLSTPTLIPHKNPSPSVSTRRSWAGPVVGLPELQGSVRIKELLPP